MKVFICFCALISAGFLAQTADAQDPWYSSIVNEVAGGSSGNTPAAPMPPAPKPSRVANSAISQPLIQKFNESINFCIKMSRAKCQFHETYDDTFVGTHWNFLTQGMGDYKEVHADAAYRYLRPYAMAMGLGSSSDPTDHAGRDLLDLAVKRLGAPQMSECQRARAVVCFTGNYITYAASIHGSSWDGVGTINSVMETQKGICADFARVAAAIMTRLGIDAQERCVGTHCVNLVSLKNEGTFLIEPQGKGDTPFQAYIPPDTYTTCNQLGADISGRAPRACRDIADIHQRNNRFAEWVDLYTEKADCRARQASDTDLSCDFPPPTLSTWTGVVIPRYAH